MAGPLIVTAQLGHGDFSWLEGLRRLHYPADRNRVPAHLTLFRSLPPSAEREVRQALARCAADAAPRAMVAGVMELGGGVAVRVRSNDLDDLRDELASDFRGLLTAQDRAGWIPHVTIQNKVEPREARVLLRQLELVTEERPLSIAGLLLWRYLDGPWEKLGSYPFRKVS